MSVSRRKGDPLTTWIAWADAHGESSLQALLSELAEMRQYSCSIDGCLRPQFSQTWCNAHFKRWQRHGDPLAGRTSVPRGGVENRFWAKVDRSGGSEACWLWTGSLEVGRYGCFNADGRAQKAHRWAYEQFIGPVPNGLDLDHLCRVRHCVNPAHLEPVTRSENLRRGYAARMEGR